MKKILFLCLFILFFAGCRKKGTQTSRDTTSFSITLDTVRASIMRHTVIPDNKEAYYAWSVYHASEVEGRSETELKEQEQSIMESRYAYGAEENLSFQDMLLYKGKRSFSTYFLTPDTDQEIIVYQVNPDSHRIIGNIYHVPFHTPAIDSISLSFDVVFRGDSLFIHPSDPTATYIWEYELEETITDDFFTANYFMHEIVRLYEEYDFIDMATTVGDAVWSFRHDDPSVQTGEDYLLLLVGYNGEINSRLTVIRFRPSL